MAVAAALAAQTAPKGDNGGNAENGKRLFSAYGCYECHGLAGQGGRSGPRIAPRPIALQALIIYVRHPAGDMPPYTNKVISDSQLADIHAYLRTIPAPAAAKSIPLLNE